MTLKLSLINNHYEETYFFLTVLFSINLCFSQNSKGVITYKKETLKYLSEDEEFKKKEKSNPQYFNTVIEIDQNVKQLLENLDFNLTFNGNESIFKVNKFLQVENDRYYGFAIGPDGNIVYYTNQKDNEQIQQIDAYGELFLVEYPIILWELINETKKIGDYTCYKATTNKMVKGRKGIIKTYVEAWYTPEIAIPFGPLGYNALPGLIIELAVGDVRYFAAKIELNSEKEIKIEKPKRGKVVTKEQFENIGIGEIEN